MRESTEKTIWRCYPSGKKISFLLYIFVFSALFNKAKATTSSSSTFCAKHMKRQPTKSENGEEKVRRADRKTRRTWACEEKKKGLAELVLMRKGNSLKGLARFKLYFICEIKTFTEAADGKKWMKSGMRTVKGQKTCTPATVNAGISPLQCVFSVFVLLILFRTWSKFWWQRFFVNISHSLWLFEYVECLKCQTIELAYQVRKLDYHLWLSCECWTLENELIFDTHALPTHFENAFVRGSKKIVDSFQVKL